MPVYRASILSVTGEILCVDGTKKVRVSIQSGWGCTWFVMKSTSQLTVILFTGFLFSSDPQEDLWGRQRNTKLRDECQERVGPVLHGRGGRLGVLPETGPWTRRSFQARQCTGTPSNVC